AVGVTSGASAPEHLVQEVVDALRRLGATQVEERELVREDVSFGLPAELTGAGSGPA
ncbi:MAG: 4-hydroxy-3-methylbut-2-enyl diphosphate reductase, partial [Elusimicrobia bacterium]